MKSADLLDGILRGSRYAALLVLGCWLVAGCQSKAAEMAPQTTDRLATLRSQLFTAKAQVQSTAAAARDLLERPRQDLGAQVTLLKNEVDQLNATRAKAREQGATYQAETQAYFSKWDEQLKGMSEETAWAGQKRLEDAKQTVVRLQSEADAVRQEILPFMADLNEATKYLSTDTTRAGLDVVQPKLRSALKHEKPILNGFDKLIEDIDSVRAGR